MQSVLQLTLPARNLDDLLSSGERLVSSFRPYHATSRRVILVNERRGERRVHELPYMTLESITEVRKSNTKQVVLGMTIAVAGVLTIFAWYLIVPVIAVIIGTVVAFQGTIGRPAYYQLRGRGMKGRELRRWQVMHYGAGSLIASISTITGVQVARTEGEY